MQPDVLYVGGIGRALRVGRMAQEQGLPVTPHAAISGSRLVVVPGAAHLANVERPDVVSQLVRDHVLGPD